MFHPGIDIMICPPSTGTLFFIHDTNLQSLKQNYCPQTQFFLNDISFLIKLLFLHSTKLTPLLFALRSPSFRLFNILFTRGFLVFTKYTHTLKRIQVCLGYFGDKICEYLCYISYAQEMKKKNCAEFVILNNE